MGNQRRDHLMGTPYIERRHVTLSEEHEDTVPGVAAESYWSARVHGPLTPSKEHIEMERSSKSAGEALLLLREALAGQGWELR